VSLKLLAFSMSSYLNPVSDAPDTKGRRQVASVVAGLVLALLSAAILIPIVQPRQLARPTEVIAKAVAASLMVAAVTACSVWLASFIAGIRSDRRVRVAAAFTSVWFIPLVVFGDQRSSQVVEAWIGISIQFACLGVLLSNTMPIQPTGEWHQPSPIPSFEGLRSQAISRDALIASFCALAGLCAVVAWRVPLAQGLFLISAIALLRRSWRMLRESPVPHSFPVNQLTYRALALTPILLVILAWFPHGMGHGTGNVKPVGDSDSAAGSKRPEQMGLANRAASAILDRVFPGVVLYPVVKSSVRLIAPPAQVVQEISNAPSKTYRIPFDGVYWFWRAPAPRPPDSAVVQQGNPSKFIFRSTDGSQLEMEAHQHLGSEVSLGCCSAIEIVIENADAHPESIGVELAISNTKLAGKPSQSLGVLPLTSSAGQTLKFRIPLQTKLQSFDELTVRFRMNWWRGSQSASVAIQSFALVPRG
jgi:hypothetical protein